MQRILRQPGEGPHRPLRKGSLAGRAGQAIDLLAHVLSQFGQFPRYVFLLEAALFDGLNKIMVYTSPASTVDRVTLLRFAWASLILLHDTLRLDVSTPS